MLSMSFWTAPVLSISMEKGAGISGRFSRTTRRGHLGSLSLKALDSIDKAVLTSHVIGSLLSKGSVSRGMQIPMTHVVMAALRSPPFTGGVEAAGHRRHANRTLDHEGLMGRHDVCEALSLGGKIARW